MSWQLLGMDAPAVWYPSQTFPPSLAGHVERGGKLAAWNCLFEHCVWSMTGRKWYGFPKVRLDQWDNTQCVSMQRNLPASLEGCADALQMPQRKDKEGAKVMRLLMTGATPAPGQLARLGAYCAQDVAVEREIGTRLGPLPAKEEAVFQLDKRINLRGIPIDAPFARLAAKAADDYQADRARAMQAQFNVNPTQVAKIGEKLAAMGVPVPDLQGDTLDAILDTQMAQFFPFAAIELLRLRREAAAVAPKKYSAMLRSMSFDERIRGVFSYCGASQTGRWSGRVMQPHNLMRPTMAYPKIEDAMKALRASNGAWQALAEHGPILEVLGNMVRPTIVAPGGVTKSDLAQIEARVLAWVAGEQRILDLFRNHEDVYSHTASSIFNRTITKADKDERQIGKVADLALGYGGGKGAFITMGRGYGVTVTEDRAEEIKVAWRESHTATTALWDACDAAAHRAISTPGVLYGVGPLTFVFTSGTLWCRLPSGRRLAWHGARVVMRSPPWELDKPEEEQVKRPVIAFQRPFGHNMVTDYTRGAIIVENVVQAISRDVLAEAMLRARHLPIFGHVHDEVWVEGEHVDELDTAMKVAPPWAEGLPIDCETDWSERYRK
jgi:DNA polymerase